MNTSAVSSSVLENQCGSLALNPWFLIRCKPCQEDRAEHFLSLLGVKVFLPLAAPNRLGEIKPFFPGYLFGNFPLELCSKVNNAYGVRKIVKFGAAPAIVPDSVIADLLDLAGRTSQKPMAKFQRGDKVAIVDGPMRGWYGIFDSDISGKDRVKILLDTLSFNHGFHQQSSGAAMSIEVGKFDLMLA